MKSPGVIKLVSSSACFQMVLYQLILEYDLCCLQTSAEFLLNILLHVHIELKT
jgi:hypothetical protein